MKVNKVKNEENQIINSFSFLISLQQHYANNKELCVCKGL